jgi:hypothetical protein
VGKKSTEEKGERGPHGGVASSSYTYSLDLYITTLSSQSGASPNHPEKAPPFSISNVKRGQQQQQLQKSRLLPFFPPPPGEE